MRIDQSKMLLYAVTADEISEEVLYDKVKKALEGGVTILQLRAKNLGNEDFIKEAKVVKELTKQYGIPFIINDNVDVAKTVDADGVHIGQDDMSITDARQILGDDKIIGVSAHNVLEAVEAEKNGADYLGSGAVFVTETKKDVSNLSKEELKRICESVSIPVVAIGGIGEHNAQLLEGTKISGIAVSSAIFASDDIDAACQNLLSKINFAAN